MGAAASIPLVAATAALPLPAAGIFVAGVAVGAAMGPFRPAAAPDVDVVNDALDSVYDAAEAVMNYVRIASSAYEKVKRAEAFVKEAEAFVKDGVVEPVRVKASAAMDCLRTAASLAFQKLKAAAAFVKDKVIKLVRHLRGSEQAAAARREVDRAAAAQDAGHDDVLSRASARVAGCGRLLDARALPPPSSAIVSATAPGGALSLLGSVAAPAARAARMASKMMARLKAVFRALRDSITEAARSCISVVAAAVGICLEAIAAPAAAAEA